MPIEDYFRRGDTPDGHPFVRFLAGRLRTGDRATFELHKPPPLVGFRKAKICIHLFRDDQEVDCKDEDWDDDLNAGLVRLGIKADSPEEERDRFALALRAGFQKPELRFGDGYFNSVLIEFIRESDFRSHPDVQSVLEHLPHIQPHRGGGYDDCREMIDSALRGRALELTEQLHYGVPEAADILAGALARYLDARFSVTNRRLLGLL